MSGYFCGLIPLFLLGVPFWQPWSELIPGFPIDLAWGSLLSLFVALLLSKTVFSLKRDLLILWGIYSGVALGAGAFYEVQFVPDGIGLFRDYSDVENYWLSPAFLKGHENYIKLVAIFRSTTLFDSYFSLKILMSAFSLAGSYLLIKSIPNPSRLKLYMIGLFPSIVFWGTQLSKDALVFFFICLAIWSFARSRWSGLVISLVSLCFFRLWLVPILLIAAIVVTPSRKLKVAGLAAFSALCLYLIFGLHLTSSEQILERINTVSHSWARGGSSQSVPHFSSLFEFLKFEPMFMFTSLFRPLPGEIPGMLGVAAGLESLVLLAATAFSFRQSNMRLAFFCLISLLVWSFVVGIVSFQNLGTAVRFRLQVLPFFAVLFWGGGFGQWLEKIRPR